MRRQLMTLATLAMTMCGCQSNRTTETTSTTEIETTPTTQTAPQPEATEAAIRIDIRELDTLTKKVQSARDGIEEGAALRKLQAWQRNHRTTFQVAAVRSDNVKPVRDNLSAYPDPLRTSVTIFRGQQPIYTFTFVPQDNRNLAIMGR